jgi:hypothetical protein
MTAELVNEDMVEMQQASTGREFKIAPTKQIGMRRECASPNLPNNIFAAGMLGAYPSSSTSISFSLSSVDKIYVGPFVVYRPVIITEIYLVVTTTAAATVRAGVYNAQSNWRVGTLVADWGTLDVSTTGRKSLTGLSTTLNPGNYYSGTATSAITPQLLSAYGSNVMSLSGPIFNAAMTSAGTAFPSTFSVAAVAAATAFPATPASDLITMDTSGSIGGPYTLLMFKYSEA